MSVKYKVVRVNQPGVISGEPLYIPRICNRNKVDLRHLSELISSRCTLHQADIMATLTALVEITPELLLENNSIELGELGILSLHIKAFPSKNAATVSADNIKNVKLSFRPGTLIKRRLNKASFLKIK